MKRQYLFGLALAAAFVCGSAAASTALAGEWLVETNTVTAELNSETEGSFDLIQLTGPKSGVDLIRIECSAIFIGKVGANAADKVTKILNLAREEIGQPLVGLALECENVVDEGAFTDCVNGAGNIVLVWPENLPWNTVLALRSPTETIDEYQSTTAFEAECMTLAGPMASLLCEGVQEAQMTNEVNFVLGVFLKKLGLCVDPAGEHQESFEMLGENMTWALEPGRLATTVS